jgi:RNA polymerase sigma factor (sigma-70 family)
VRRIATRASLHLQRRRRWRLLLLADEPAITFPAPDPDRAARLYQALECLSDRERVAFVLHYQEGLSFADVAAAVGCREGTARNYAFRASKKLRRQLGDLV